MSWKYRRGVSMGSPEMTSMADATSKYDAGLIVNALEQIAAELRTANLIALVDINGGDPEVGAEILRRIGYVEDDQ